VKHRAVLDLHRRPVVRLAGVALAVLVGCAPVRSGSDGAGPRFSDGGPEAEEYGAGDGYRPSAIYRPRFFVGAFSHHDELLEGRRVARAGTPSRLGRAPAEPALRYEYEGHVRTLDEYLARNPTTGLIIARGDTILVERYQYARNDRHRLASFSMAKTVTAMLVGVATAEGRIRSVDDPAEAYVPELAGTEYGRTSLRHLLQMASGVLFTENYSGMDDAARLVADTFVQVGQGGVEAVKPYDNRVRPGGTAFAYASAETQVLGLVLRGAVGRPVAEYFQEKIWQPIGAEADAAWLIDRAGQEATYCCLNAVLRDYARLGLLLAHDGAWRGRQLIPAAWVVEATSAREGQPEFWAGRAVSLVLAGYGYQTWLLPGQRRMFALLGAHGQAIYVDPASRLVMVHTAVRRLPFDLGPEAFALWRAVVEQLGGRATP
jgi:CubicO group peptidase (beta-lactamase class C family)